MITSLTMELRCSFFRCTGFSAASCIYHSPPTSHALSNPSNIGHLLSDEYFAAFAAMELFNVVSADSQMILIKPCTFDAVACARGYNESMRGLSALPARTLDSYASGTCFRRVIMGHSMAFGHAFSSSFRGPTALRFRDFFLDNLGLGWMYREVLREHFILMVRKQAGSGASDVWPHLCDHAPALQSVFPGVKVACIDGMQMQSLASQVQMFAAASVVVVPHGGVLHLCNFARNGASVIALVDHGQVTLRGSSPRVYWQKHACSRACSWQRTCTCQLRASPG
jgi:hypothetical protein